MLDRDVVDALFPPDLPEPGEFEDRFPPRRLPEGVEVTRFAPSPTGHLHVGSLYTATVSWSLARQTGGVHLLRIEDTDRARLLPGAAERFVRVLRHLGLPSDEGEGDAAGAWGPYRQSLREDVYLAYVRDLMRGGSAYPCFCDKERLARNAEEQRASRSPVGYYGRWASCRTLPPDEAARLLDSGVPHVVRFRCPHEIPRRIRFRDEIRGTVTMLDNGNDVVLLKAPQEGRRLPTYHLAHVVDDHLMRVTLVVRGEEWLPSVPLHLQLHSALGIAPPRYAHLAPLMKAEGSGRRKLSKRKDPEASVDYYLTAGYPAAAIRHYLRGLANSRLMDLPFDAAADAPLRLREMGLAGPLLDLPKLRSISRAYIASLRPEQVYDEVVRWAADHDGRLHEVYLGDRAAALRAIAVAQGGDGQPRKDLACWADLRERYGFLHPELFVPVREPGDARFLGMDPELVRQIAADFALRYDHAGRQETWLDQIRSLAERHGYAPGARAYREHPERYLGPARQVANVVRVCLTGSTVSPDLFEVARALGEPEVLRRMRAVAADPDRIADAVSR
ncbi:glutamate--tRNA ligase [Microbispora rosea subsp. aerata]|nr:glutamate--tRNA ligase family protein [Microbispora rosea]GGO27363.1 glutamate--tRNA ligase [Microbispora rosea subsp. aerata]GIH57636.1 glutamate--tRNA ligase [Microbispora rosea subsp. aerata]GLJ86814.1 glutamate--tRNA ligase [Microbispora rosea subsp. aerata]